MTPLRATTPGTGGTAGWEGLLALTGTTREHLRLNQSRIVICEGGLRKTRPQTTRLREGIAKEGRCGMEAEGIVKGECVGGDGVYRIQGECRESD